MKNICRLLLACILASSLLGCASAPTYGQGNYASSRGDTYTGNFSNGKFHGFGKYTFAEGSSYEGQWKDGSYSGQGIYTDEKGNSKEGVYSGNSLNSKGVWKKNGRVFYEGDFKNSQPHGVGRQFDAEGKVAYEGYWKNGRQVSETEFVNPPYTVKSETKPVETPPIYVQQPPTIDFDLAKTKCEELGFKSSTEGFGKCVLQLTK